MKKTLHLALAGFLFFLPCYGSEKISPPWIVSPYLGGWTLASGTDIVVGGSFGARLSKRFEDVSWLSYGIDGGAYVGISGLLGLATVYPLFGGGGISFSVSFPILATLTAHSSSGVVRPFASLGLGPIATVVAGTKNDGTRETQTVLGLAGMTQLGLEFWFSENFSINWDAIKIGFFRNQFLGEMGLSVSF